MTGQEAEIRFTDGAAYDRFMGPWSRKVGAVFLEWLAAPAGLSWLEIGCGTGMFTELLLDSAAPARVVGIDPAPAQIAHARSKPVADRAEFRVGDAHELPFGARAFDAVASALVFNFIADLPRALGEMRRVTRPGGWVGGYVWDLTGELSVLRYLQAPIKALKPEIPRTPGIEQSRIAALTQIFAGAGLDDVMARPIDVARSYASFDEYWQVFLDNPNPLSAFASGLPPAEHESLRQAMRAGMPVAADGTVTFTARANAIKARVPE